MQASGEKTSPQFAKFLEDALGVLADHSADGAIHCRGDLVLDSFGGSGTTLTGPDSFTFLEISPSGLANEVTYHLNVRSFETPRPAKGQRS